MDIATAADRIIEMATKRGWSEAKLQRRAGISAATWRNMKRGHRDDGYPTNPKPDTVRKIADAFGGPEGVEVLRMLDQDEQVENFLQSQPVIDLPEWELLDETERERLRAFAQGMLSQRAVGVYASANSTMPRYLNSSLTIGDQVEAWLSQLSQPDIMAII